MPGGFTVYVKGEEVPAENLAWACGKIFGRPATFLACSGVDRPGWSFIVRTRPDDIQADETRAWEALTESLFGAASGMDLAPQFPATRELRAKLDRFIRYVESHRATYPGTEVMIGLPGERPSLLSGVQSRELAWRLMT